MLRRSRVAALAALSVGLGGMASLTTVSPAVAVLPAETAVLELPFDGDLTDVSSHANPVAVRTGAIGYEPGIIGQAATFNGSTALNLGTGTHLQPQDLTLSFWFKPAAAMGTGEQVFTWSKTTYNSDGWYLASENGSVPLALSIGPSSSQPYKVSVKTPRNEFFPAGQWTHVVVTYDHESKAVAMYRNGMKQATTIDYAVSANASGVLGSTSAMKTIGFNGPQYNGSFLTGALDEWRVHDGVASVSEVVELYREGVPAFDPASVAQADLDLLTLPQTVTSGLLALPLLGSAGSQISWSADSPHVSISDGIATIQRQEDAYTVTFTASASYAGSDPVTKTYQVQIPSVHQTSVFLQATELGEVTMEDEYLHNLDTLNTEYLLSLSAEKFLYSFYVQAGLTPPTATGYGGWERSSGTRFQGHFFGHYITALAQAYAAETDTDTKAALLAELTTAVEGLAETQAAYAAANPANAGYVSPFPVSYLPAGGSGLLVPFYNLHKVLAGLLDAYTYAPDEVSAQALDVASKFGTWTRNYAQGLSNPGSILATEYGGMNEALYELFSITHDPVHKRAAEYFDEVTLFQQLSNGQDVLAGKHANTTIPKLVGALKRYTVFTDDPELYGMLTPAEQASLPMYLAAAENFWQIVIDHHTYANGGNSQSEHFHGPDELHQHATNGSTSGYGENSTSEGCNEYNMLKLSADLFRVTGDVKYLDYYEHAYINAVVSTANPETAMVTYFEPMTSGYAKVFGNPLDEFWCDHGTGVEKLSMLQSSFYYTDTDSVVVAQLRSSTFTDARHNMVLTQVADVPADPEVTLSVAALEGTEIAEGTSLRLRVPEWVDGTPTLTVNGTAVAVEIRDGFIEVPVVAGDEISYTVPATVRVIADAGNPDWVAFAYGPVLLAAPVSYERVGESYVAGVLVRMSTADKDVVDSLVVDDSEQWKADIAQNLVRIEDGTTPNGAFPTLRFELRNTDQDSAQLVFEPFYSLYDARYALYLNLVEPDSEAAQGIILERKVKERDAATSIDQLISFDNNNSEAGKNYQYSSDSSVGVWNGVQFRHATNATTGWFSYDMTVDPAAEHNYLCVRYYRGDVGRSFDVYVNDEKLKTETIVGPNSNEWYVQCDEIPRSYLQDPRTKVDSTGAPVLDENGEEIPVVTVRFQANGRSVVGGVFGLWIRDALSYDTDAELSALSFDVGTVDPAFAPGTREYTLTVPEGTTAVEMTAAPHLPSGLVRVDGVLIDDTRARHVPLTGETTTVAIQSVAQDHTTTADYTLTVQVGEVVAPVESPFVDVAVDNPFFEEITWLASEGVSTGWLVSDGAEFRPYNNVTRDAMAAFLYRLAGSPEFTAPGVSPFRDVSTSNGFYREIAWLASEEISTGWPVVGGAAEFRPYAHITRDAMAAFLYRYSGEPDFTAPAVSPFVDVTPATPFYREITWLADTGVSTGWPSEAGQEYRPVAKITRDAMAAFLHRLTVAE